MMPVELSDSVLSSDKSSLKNSDEIYRYRETSTFFFIYILLGLSCKYLFSIQACISYLEIVWKREPIYIFKIFKKKNVIFLYFKSFLYANFKNNFLKNKKIIILIYFKMKSTLKNNHSHTLKHT